MNKETRKLVITIDGPSGSGKGSLALNLARKLGFHILDSGAIYRLAALKALKENIALEQEQQVLQRNGDGRLEFDDAVVNIGKDARLVLGEEIRHSILSLTGPEERADV